VIHTVDPCVYDPQQVAPNGNARPVALAFRFQAALRSSRVHCKLPGVAL
jgi:hypothetical protein